MTDHKLLIVKTCTVCILITIYFISCQPPVHINHHEYHYQKPDYKSISLLNQPDTLRFGLKEDTYNEIKSFNYFTDNNVHYIAFFDRRSASINVYYFYDQQLYKKISIKDIFRNHSLYKTSVFVKNWDSIFVINKFHIYLFDSSGHKKADMEFPETPKYTVGMFDSNKLPVFKDNQVYVITRPNVSEKKFNSLREWKILYSIDFNPESQKMQLYYHLPYNYQTNLYGYHFLDYNLCYNNRGKFVLSFPADTLLYETDLQNYNHSYFARSQYQDSIILPVSRQELENDEGLKAYALRDSYGSVFFDPQKKYYLRLARHKLSPEEFKTRERKKETVLILDEQFHIIGECDWPVGIDFDSLFFTPDGQIYARTKFKDEQALHFVRFAYKGQNDKTQLLTTASHMNKSNPKK